MIDLRKRFAEADRVGTPDVWADAEARAERIADGTASRLDGSPKERSHLVAAVVAFAVFAAAAAFAWSVLRPTATPSSIGGRPRPPGWLVELAQRTASNNRDPNPTSARWVFTDSKTAAPALGLTADQANGEPEYLVVLTGDFTAILAKGPIGAPAPKGTTLVFTADPWTHMILDWGVSNKPVDVPGLRAFSLAPSPSTDSGDAIAIDGVPFKVCRPMTLAGDFGGGRDTAWVFEEERVPGAGCMESEGFQRLGIGSGSRVQLLSDRITDLLTADAYKVWPDAALDLNGDGVDEIAVAKQGDPATSRTLWFFQIVGHGNLAPVLQNCGPACDPTPFSTTIGLAPDHDGTSTQSGTYCEGQGSSQLVIEWSAKADDPLLVSERTLAFADGLLEVVSRRSYRVASVDEYPPSGFGDLCGSSTQEP
ncbi:MAG: hypothetical protein HY240_07100 [Actinobacteria bacterium]|nr:hypothetical protein [Actinomycetota bacterium]